MMPAFVDELELFRTEEEAAQQYFFGYLSLQNVPGSNPAVLSRLNDTPTFWITTRHALLLAAFVALGRIFDQDARSIHNINKLMRSVSDNIAIFTRAGLEQRKIADGLTAKVSAEYVQGKYDLTTNDVRGMRKAVAYWRAIYEARYRDIRHGVFAHKGLTRADTDLLMAKTNIEEMKTMFGFLHSLHLSLWQLYFNGRKPDLTPATFVMPPLRGGGGLKAGERVYRDSLDVLYGMLSPSEAGRDDD